MKKITTFFALSIGLIMLSISITYALRMEKHSNVPEAKYLIANVEALTQNDLDISFFWMAENISTTIWKEEFPTFNPPGKKIVTFRQVECFGVDGDLFCTPSKEIIDESFSH